MTKIKEVVSSILFYAIVVFLVAFIAMQVIRPADNIGLLGFNIYMTSNTRSMEPMLKYNDLAIVKNVDFDTLKKGDVIAFYGKIHAGDTMVTAPALHQIVEVAKTEDGELAFYTKGINNETNPKRDLQPTTEKGVGDTNTYIGKYVFKIPYAGYIFDFAKTPYGIITIAGNVIIIMAIGYLRKKDDDEESTAITDN